MSLPFALQKEENIMALTFGTTMALIALSTVAVTVDGHDSGVISKLFSGDDENNALVAEREKCRNNAQRLVDGEEMDINDVHPGLCITIGDGVFAGAATLVHRMVSIAFEVGQVITAYNAWMTVEVFSRTLLVKGWNNVFDILYYEHLRRQNDPTKVLPSRPPTRLEYYMATAINEFFCYMFDWNSGGKNIIQTYQTPLRYRCVDGQMTVFVTAARAKKATVEASMINRHLLLDEVVQIALDQCAIKRFYGEKTIDSDKKPDPYILAGIFLFDRLLNVKQQGKVTIEIQLALEEDVKQVILKGGVRKEFRQLTDVDVFESSNELFSCCTRNGNNVISMYDYVQDIRLPLFLYLSRFGFKVISEISALQYGLSKDENEAVDAAADSLGIKADDVIAVLQEFVEHWWTVSSVYREDELEENANVDISSKVRIEIIEQAKKSALSRDKNLSFRDVANQLRLFFELVGVNDPVQRIRLMLLAAKRRQETKEQAKLGISLACPESLLQEEFILWILAATKGDNRVPKETRDVVRCGKGFSATPAQLQRLAGNKVPFVNGSCQNKKGVEMLRGDMELNGIFTLKLDDGDKLVATRPIAEMVTVPKADHTKRYVILASQKTEADVQVILDKLYDGPTTLVPTNKVGLLKKSNGEQVGTFRIAQNAASVLQPGRKLYAQGRDNFIGEITFQKVYSYVEESTKTTKWSAFVEFTAPAQK